MGVPEESQTLLPRQPESMGGAVNGSREPLWQRLKDRISSSITRKKVRTALGVLLIISIIVALFGSTISVHSGKVSTSFHSLMTVINEKALRGG
jgi:hypothetical protein